MGAATSPVGRHVCCVVDSASDEATHLASWVQDGLAAGARVVHVEALDHDGAFLECLDDVDVDVEAALATGRLLVIRPEDAYLCDGSFDPAQRIARHRAFVERSMADGCRGVRMSGTAAGALTVVPDRRSLLDYETRLESLVHSHPVWALCLYDRVGAGDELPAVLAAHPRDVVDGELRATAEPGRLRFSGELDFVGGAALTGVLAAASTEDGRLVVDLGGVSFVDVAGTARLVEMARRVAPVGRVEIASAPPLLHTILVALGWDDEVDIVPRERVA